MQIFRKYINYAAQHIAQQNAETSHLEADFRILAVFGLTAGFILLLMRAGAVAVKFFE